MTLTVQCPNCAESFVIQPALAGKTLRCRQCAAQFSAMPIPADPVERQQPRAMPPEPGTVQASGARPRAPQPRSSEATQQKSPPRHDSAPDYKLADMSMEDVAAVQAQLPALPRARAQSTVEPAPAKKKKKRKPIPSDEGGVPRYLIPVIVTAVVSTFFISLFVKLASWGATDLETVGSSRSTNTSTTSPGMQSGQSDRGNLLDLSVVPPPAFPERGPSRYARPGVVMHEINLGPTDGYPATPGHGGRLWLYLPEGFHAQQSLTCVLIAPAGSNLLTGKSLSADDQGEHIPYAQAGFAVMAYELDGPVDEDPSNARLFRGYAAFRGARGGLVNARNAMEYILAKVPEVHPQRIFAVGHSSAGTLALLYTAHDPRIHGCVAFAASSDTRAGFRELLNVPNIESRMVGLENFIKSTSPSTHEALIHCPVLLFHAHDDMTVPIAQSVDFHQRLQAHNRAVSLETVPTGNHYDSMIQKGIPLAIQWMRARETNPTTP